MQLWRHGVRSRIIIDLDGLQLAANARNYWRKKVERGGHKAFLHIPCSCMQITVLPNAKQTEMRTRRTYTKWKSNSAIRQSVRWKRDCYQRPGKIWENACFRSLKISSNNEVEPLELIKWVNGRTIRFVFNVSTQKSLRKQAADTRAKLSETTISLHFAFPLLLLNFNYHPFGACLATVYRLFYPCHTVDKKRRENHNANVSLWSLA